MKALKPLPIFVLIACIAVIYSCKKEDAMDAIKNDISSETPTLPAQPYDYSDKLFTGQFTREQIELGRVLFYDKKMSLNNSISCGSCHKQSFAFSDNKAFSTGLENKLTTRNSPPVLNHGSNMFWDGRANDLRSLTLMPVQNHVEMKIFDLDLLNDKFANTSYYPALFTKAYGSPEVTTEKIRNSLWAFLMCFTSRSSKYDKVIMGQAQYTTQEQIGSSIFNDKGRCSGCHNGTDLNGWVGAYENIGLDMTYSDQGRKDFTGYAEDEGKFKVPTLRNIALTGPYMHDGRYKTLEEVIDHYSDGIQNHPNLSWALKDFSGVSSPDSLTPVSLNSLPAVHLGLNTDEKKALKAFLLTLTDISFVTDQRFEDPFKK